MSNEAFDDRYELREFAPGTDDKGAPNVAGCGFRRAVPDRPTRAGLPTPCPATTPHRATSTAPTHEPRTVRLRASPEDATTEPHRAGFVMRAGSSSMRTVPDSPTRATLPAPCPATTPHGTTSTAPTDEPSTVRPATRNPSTVRPATRHPEPRAVRPGTRTPPPTTRSPSAGRDPGLQSDRTKHASVVTSPGPDSVGT